MTRVRIYTTLNKESIYCLLIQFSPLKTFLYNHRHTTIEYHNKKDMKYSIEMLKEVKINNKYLKFKILDENPIFLCVTDCHVDILCKFGPVAEQDGEVFIKFTSEKEMLLVYEILKNAYVDYKKLSVCVKYKM